MIRTITAAFGAAFLCLPAFAQPVSPIWGAGLFNPNFGDTRTISATTTSASTTLTGADAANTEILIYNAGPDIAFVRWGNGPQTATTSDLFLPPGAIQAFTKGNSSNGVAIRAGTSSATVYFITGAGQ